MMKVPGYENFGFGKLNFPFYIGVLVNILLPREGEPFGSDVEAEVLNSVNLFLTGPLILYSSSLIPHCTSLPEYG